MEGNTVVYGLLLLSLVGSAACTILFKNLIKAAIMLALASAVLTAVMFLMGATLAAVLELSVCSGMITAVFVSTISLTKNQTRQEQADAARLRRRKTAWLPLVLAAVGVAVWILFPNLPLALGEVPSGADSAARAALWDAHQLDILGSILVVLAGVFGVVVLFKGKAVGK